MGTKRWIHPEGSEAFPTTAEAEQALREIGFAPEDETGTGVTEAEEEKPKRGKKKE